MGTSPQWDVCRGKRTVSHHKNSSTMIFTVTSANCWVMWLFSQVRIHHNCDSRDKKRVSVCVWINWSHSALTGPRLAQDQFLYSVKLEARFCCSLEDICPSFLWRTFSFTVFVSVSCFFCYIVPLIFIPDFFFWLGPFYCLFFSSWIPLGNQRFHQRFGGTLIQGCVFPSVMRPWEDYSLRSASVA